MWGRQLTDECPPHVIDQVDDMWGEMGLLSISSRGASSHICLPLCHRPGQWHVSEPIFLSSVGDCAGHFLLHVGSFSKPWKPYPRVRMDYAGAFVPGVLITIFWSFENIAGQTKALHTHDRGRTSYEVLARHLPPPGNWKVETAMEPMLKMEKLELAKRNHWWHIYLGVKVSQLSVCVPGQKNTLANFRLVLIIGV